MNPCPCGYRGSRANDCRCDGHEICGEIVGSAARPHRSARHRRAHYVCRDGRFGRHRVVAGDSDAGRGCACNAEIAAADVRAVCRLDTESMQLLENAMTRGSVSARAFDRVARFARTIADLADSPAITRAHVAEALLYRSVDRSTRSAA